MENRGLVFIVVRQQNSQIVMGVSVCGDRVEGRSKLAAPPLVSSLNQRRSQVDVGGKAPGVCRDCLVKFIDRFAVSSGFEGLPCHESGGYLSPLISFPHSPTADR